MPVHHRMWSVVAVMALSWGCAHARVERPAAEPPPSFRLGREDVVEISVYRDPDLTRTVPVRPDGRISLPLVGEVEADGLTPDELRAAVVERLGAYVQQPAVVSVIVREVNSARFFVVGEVGRPGAYPLRGRVTVLQALALAGGLGEYSARDGVTVLRGPEPRALAFSWESLSAGGAEFALHPGDTVVVR